MNRIPLDLEAIHGRVDEMTARGLRVLAFARGERPSHDATVEHNFASIAAAVEEGRGVYDNLVKFITWTLPTNVGQGLVILIAVLLDITLPILPGQILWINMTTAVFLGLTLAFETKEPDLMQRPPRHPDQPILTGHLIFRTVLVGLLLAAGSSGLLEWELMHGESIEKARTAAVNVFAVGQTFYLLNCRSLTQSMFKLGLFSNGWLWSGITVMLLAQAAFTYVPALHWLFHTAPIGRDEWLLTVGAGAVIYLLIGFEKWIGREFRFHRQKRVRSRVALRQGMREQRHGGS